MIVTVLFSKVPKAYIKSCDLIRMDLTYIYCQREDEIVLSNCRHGSVNGRVVFDFPPREG